MPVQYFTLRALCNELRPAICDATITDVFSQKRNELLISIRSTSNQEAIDRGRTISISIEPKHNHFFIHENFSRAKRNSVGLFDIAVGGIIRRLSIHPCDRTIYIELHTKIIFVIKIYNTVESNIYLTDGHNNVVETFKNNKELAGATVFPPERQSHELTSIGSEMFKAASTKTGKLSAFSAFKKMFPLFGSDYTHEIFHRCGILDTAPADNLDEKSFSALRASSRMIFEELTNPQPRIIVWGKEQIVSLTHLDHLQDSHEETFQSVNEAVRNFIFRSYGRQNVSDEKKQLHDKLSHELGQASRAAGKVKSRGNRSPDELEQCGTVLLSNLSAISKGSSEVELPVIYGNAFLIRIALDPGITPVQNAERYFEKAKKLRATQAESSKRSKYIEKKMELLDNLISSLEKCQTGDDIVSFKENNKEILRSMKLLQEKPGMELPPFRIFSVAGGFEVWAGKSSSNNDLLTTKYSKPNDIWFHARGASGSHTILRIPNDVKSVPKESIRQAAGIAAYYSKMRKASNVPVAYCERKYVRKRKGSPEGTVFLEREEVIFVKPALP